MNFALSSVTQTVITSKSYFGVCPATTNKQSPYECFQQRGAYTPTKGNSVVGESAFPRNIKSSNNERYSRKEE